MQRFKKIKQMEVKINIGYSQVFELVSQLPKTDIQRLMNHLKVQFEIPAKEQICNNTTTPIQKLILQAPTWTDEEYNNHLEVRKFINQSRLK